MIPYRVHRFFARAAALRLSPILALSMLIAAPAVAQSGPGREQLRGRIEERYDVLVTRDAISLRPRGSGTDLRWIELTDDVITVDGRPVTGAELRDALGDDADWILQLSYLDQDDRRALFEDRERSRRRMGGRLEIGDSVRVGPDESIARDVVAIGGSVTVDGDVRGTVVAVGGDVVLGPTAVVNRDVVVIGGRLQQDPGARVGGEVHEINVSGWDLATWTRRRALGDFWPGPTLGALIGLSATISRIAILTLFALIVVLLGRDYVEAIGARAAAEPLKAGAVGVLTQLLFVPVLIVTTVMLVITIIGIPLLALIPFAILGVLLVFLVGFTAVAQRIGRVVSGRFGWGSGPYAATFIGIVVVLLPVLVARVAAFAGGAALPMTFGLNLAGTIFEYLVWTVGFGAAAMAWLGSTRLQRSGAAGVPGTTPA